MSVCVTIRTKKLPVPEEVLKAMANKGEQIVVTSMEYPCVKYGTHYKALRGIEINEEDNGVEVRVCTFASEEDYRLFGKTINPVMEMTGGKAYVDDDDDSEVTDPLKEFGEEWIQDQLESSMGMLKIMICRYGKPVTLYGLFADICLGPHLLKDFGITVDTEITKEVIDELQKYLVSVQWHLARKNDTSTRMVMPDPNDPEGEGKHISMISIKDGKVSDFDYVSYADILGIMDLDNPDSQPVLIPFHKIDRALANKKFRFMDEYQVERVAKLTPDDVRNIMEHARVYQPDDLMYQPIFPGEGFDERQNTVILMWNPSVSSVKLEDHNKSIPNIYTDIFNWSVWDHENAKCGDRFFLVRCGEGKTGIVMSGVFDSQPYPGRKGSKTYYMDMVPNLILNPEEAPMITVAELEKAIPSFKWNGGHSGRILPQEDAKKLEEIWADFLAKHEEDIDRKTLNAIEQIKHV